MSEFIIKLKEDIPNFVLYCVPELLDDICISIYDIEIGKLIVYGNRNIIAEYITELLREYS